MGEGTKYVDIYLRKDSKSATESPMEFFQRVETLSVFEGDDLKLIQENEARTTGGIPSQ